MKDDPLQPEALQRARLAALASQVLLEDPRDLQKILQSVVEITERLLPADSASIILPGEESYVAATTVPGQKPGVVARNIRREGGATAEILRTRSPLFVPDIRRMSFEPNPMLREHGFQGFLGYPLLWKGEVLGVLYALFRTRRELTEQDRDFIKILSMRAAHALALSRLYRRLEELALLDDLTGVYNRRGFFQVAQGALARAIRDREFASLVILDMDRFKELNDALGHLAGDRALVVVARTLRENLRESDIVGRYGGDEFLLFLPGTRGEEAREAVERIQEALEEKHPDHPLSLSAGVATFDPGREDRVTLQDLLRRADRALYEAKRKRRAVRLASPS